VKVLKDDGVGKTAGFFERALDWVIANRAACIKVVNLNLSGGLAIDAYTNDPVCVKVRQLSAGNWVVAAAETWAKYSNGKTLQGIFIRREMTRRF